MKSRGKSIQLQQWDFDIYVHSYLAGGLGFFPSLPVPVDYWFHYSGLLVHLFFTCVGLPQLFPNISRIIYLSFRSLTLNIYIIVSLNVLAKHSDFKTKAAYMMAQRRGFQPS